MRDLLGERRIYAFNMALKLQSSRADRRDRIFKLIYELQIKSTIVFAYENQKDI
jgi:hypothetical protein